MLVQELVDKLPPSYKLEWVRYKRGKISSPLRLFTNFATEIVSDVSEVTEFCTLSVSDRECRREYPRKESSHVHDSDQRWNEETHSEASTRACWSCGQTDHVMRNCEEFRRMSIAERLEEVENLGLCGICLNKHGGSHCFSSIQCNVRDCRGNHHPLLHRVEESVQLQKANSNCAVIFRMIPITLHVGNRQIDTVAFLDEGSSATLVDDTVAKRLNAKGVREPLIVTWTGNINRYENESRCVEMMVSARGSMEKFSLYNARTVTELQLPKQDVRYAEVARRYAHLADVPVDDSPTGVPTVLVGLDNLHLFAPQESRIGRAREPIAVRSKLGWTIYGSEKRRAEAHTYVNVHSVRTGLEEISQNEETKVKLANPGCNTRWSETDRSTRSKVRVQQLQKMYSEERRQNKCIDGQKLTRKARRFQRSRVPNQFERNQQATVARMEINCGNPEPDADSETVLRAGECSASTAALRLWSTESEK
nr:uncharacterized protein LOC115267718 [Aedes albopictus]